MPLTLEDAHKLVGAAVDHATSLGVSVTALVVDEGGHLLALARMDGAHAMSVDIALSKAVNAAFSRRDGATWAKVEADRPATFERVVRLMPRPFVSGLGSVLLNKDGRFAGALGVSGASSSEDGECAAAAVESLGI